MLDGSNSHHLPWNRRLTSGIASASIFNISLFVHTTSGLENKEGLEKMDTRDDPHRQAEPPALLEPITRRSLLRAGLVAGSALGLTKLVWPSAANAANYVVTADCADLRPGVTDQIYSYLGMQGGPLSITFNGAWSNPNPFVLGSWTELPFIVTSNYMFQPGQQGGSNPGPIWLDAQLNPVYTNFDAFIDYLRNTLGQYYFHFQLGSMPTAIGWNGPWTVPTDPDIDAKKEFSFPSDVPKWQELVRGGVDRMINFHGIDPAYIVLEAWQEPETQVLWYGRGRNGPNEQADGDQRDEDYLDFYQITYNAVRDVTSVTPVVLGGHASWKEAAGGRWGLETIIQKMAARGLGIEIMGWQGYPWETPSGDLLDSLTEGIDYVAGQLSNSGFSATTPQYINGWNVEWVGTPPSPPGPPHPYPLRRHASYLAANVLRELRVRGSNGLVYTAAWYAFDLNDPSGTENAHLSLIQTPYPASPPDYPESTWPDARRPAYAACQMLNALADGVGTAVFLGGSPFEALGVVKGSNEAVAALIVNDTATNHNVSVRFQNLPWPQGTVLNKVLQRIDSRTLPNLQGVEDGLFLGTIPTPASKTVTIALPTNDTMGNPPTSLGFSAPERSVRLLWLSPV